MKMEQNRTPIYDAILQHQQKQPLSFHVPGHKSGTVLPAKANLFRQSFAFDLTELPGLDDLHSASGVIREAEDLLSSFYQSLQSWFLVGGSTVGNIAMINSVCQKGDRVLVQRNSHRSILNAIELSGAQPIFMAPEVHQESGIATVPSVETIDYALKEYPEVCALILTHPNYYGMSVDLQFMIEKAHAHDIPVLVDEAHGAHFVLGDPFPRDALQCGADAVVQSAHKTLPAMTMGAYLHIQGERINPEKISHWLGLIQSSSPSYPIMASLDLARFYLAQLTGRDITEIKRDTERTRLHLQSIPGMNIVQSCNSIACNAIDPLKVTLQTESSMSGFEFARALEAQGVYPELADPRNVLLILPLTRFDDTKLIEVIKKSLPSPATKQNREVVFSEFQLLSVSEQPISQHTTNVPLRQAVECISAQEVTPYPPGIPLILRGERITSAQIHALKEWQEAGGRFQSGQGVVNEGIDIYVESKSG